MRKFLATVAVLALVGCASAPPKPVPDINLGTIAASSDGVRYSAYPNGDKPVGGCSTPSGWTLLAKGDASGEWCEVSGTAFDGTVAGTNDEGNELFVEKTCGSSDCQVQALVPDVGTWTGHSETFTQFGVGICETNGDSAWCIRASIKTDGTPICKAGTPGPDDLNTSGSGSAPLYLAVTRDQSADEWRCLQSSDGAAWTTYGTTTRAYASAAIGGVWGTSHAPVATTTASITAIDLATTIDVYTPADPPGGSPPTLISSIGNQSGTQGVAFSLDFSGNFSGETSYSISEGSMPSGSGLSLNTSTGVLSGTPTASDVSASPYSRSLCGVNGDGSTCDPVQFTFSSSSGSVFSITATTTARTYTCSSTGGANGANWSTIRSSGSATKPGAGDVIVLAGGTHGRLTFVGCVGSSGSYLTIRNDTSSGSKATIQASANVLANWLCTDCHYVDFTGLGKWSGAPAGTCGVTVSGGSHTEGTTQCGIKFTTSGTCGTTFLRFNGDSSDFKIRGIEIDGSARTAGGSCIGIAFQDNSVLYTDYDNSNPYVGPWRENIVIANNYVHDAYNECMYLGPNGYNQQLPIRALTVENNIINDCGRAGMQTKYVLSGSNYIRYNHVDTTGTLDPSDNGHDIGIGAFDGGNVELYGNKVFNSGGSGIACNNQNTTIGTNPANSPAPQGFQGPYYCKIYNNIVARPGSIAGHPDACTNITVGSSSHPGTRADIDPAYIYNNTVISCGTGANIGSTGGSTKVIRNNLCGSNTTCVSGGTTQTNNNSGSTATRGFVNAGADNYELASGSSACDAASSADGLTTDYAGETRPAGAANDQGADESSVCP